MFNRQDERMGAEISNSSNTISRETSIKGSVETSGNLRVEGKVIGDIKARSKVVLGESSYVEGKIFAQNADIEGKIKGTIEVENLLTLKANCLIEGDIFTQKLVVESGAKLEGNCKMGKNAVKQNTPQTPKYPKKETKGPTEEAVKPVATKVPSS
ncbi:MAG: bactofilin family protein [Cyclobacteriaceae bacterium]